MGKNRHHRAIVKKLHRRRRRRHRSLENKRDALKDTTEPKPSHTTYTTIRSISKAPLADKNLSRYDANGHSVVAFATHHHQDRIQEWYQTEDTVNSSETSSRPIRFITPRPHYRPTSQQIRSKWIHDNANRVSPQQDDHSTKTVRSSKLSEFKILYPSSDRMGITREHHRQPDEKKKKKCSHLCIILSLLVGFLLVATIVIVPAVLLTRPKAKSKNAELRWNPNGITVAGIAGQTGVAADRLTNPFSLAIDHENTLYITDSVCHRVQRWLRDASTGSTVAGLPNCSNGSALNQLASPAGIILDSDSNLYIADAGNSRILLWPQGATSGMIVAGNGVPGNSNNQLNTPYGISRDPNSGTLYVLDTGNQRIMRYLANATSGTLVAGGNGAGTNYTQLYIPLSVYFESSSNSLVIGNYVANNVVRWIIGDNRWNLIAGSTNQSSGVSATLLNTPIGVTLDPMGNIYVADALNHRIQFFSSGQSAGITIAGETNTMGANSTRLNAPYGLALDNQLNLYVADTNNNRIQKFMRY